jgi:5-methyltetrahydrofolate--homocysteine methyltransferase
VENGKSAFLELLARQVLVFDGAMGTTIHRLNLPLSDYRGLENCSEILNETRPEVIEQVHRAFFEVGCDAVETNTFGANRIVLADFGLAERTYELNLRATWPVRLAPARGSLLWGRRPTTICWPAISTRCADCSTAASI